MSCFLAIITIIISKNKLKKVEKHARTLVLKIQESSTCR